MINLNQCPICGGIFRPYSRAFGEYPVVLRAPFGRILMVADVRYSQCTGCEVVFQNPRLRDDEIKEFYEGGYYRQYFTSGDVVGDEQRRSERILDDICNFHAEKDLPDPVSHLDYGCGQGTLLEMTGDWYGCETCGVDIGSDNAWPSTPPEGKTFDLITSVHNLEHLTDPLAWMEETVSLLNPGGALLVEVPSENSTGGPLRLAHTFYFTEESLRNLFNAFGLSIEKLETLEHTQIIARKPHETLSGLD